MYDEDNYSTLLLKEKKIYDYFDTDSLQNGRLGHSCHREWAIGTMVHLYSLMFTKLKSDFIFIWILGEFYSVTQSIHVVK